MEFVNEPVFDKDRYLAACDGEGRELCDPVKNCEDCHNSECVSICGRFPWVCTSNENI